MNDKNILFPEIKLHLSFDKKLKKSELVQIRSAADANNVFKQIFCSDTFDWKEEMIMLCLNRANRVIGFYKVSSGGMTGTVVDPRVIFTVALNCAASSIVIAHNHPSGQLHPSEADKQITQKLKNAGDLMDIHLIDHLIIADEGFYSFADHGAL
jgi:DNA repair protein RadC